MITYYRIIRREYRNIKRRVVSSSYHFFSRKTIEKWKVSHEWFFIIGTNNSGTTLLQKIIKSHPEISDMGAEGQFRTYFLANDKRLGVDRLSSQHLEMFRLTENDEAQNERVFFDWWFAYQGPKKRMLMEKSTPNILRTRWLQRWFNNPKFLVIVRTPYAVVEGMLRKVNCSFEEATNHWKTVHEVLRNDSSHLENLKIITYSDLTDNTAVVLEEIYDFLSVESRNDMLNKKFTIHGVDSKIENRNHLSIAKLSDDQIRYINENCQELMTHYGLPVQEV